MMTAPLSRYLLTPMLLLALSACDFGGVNGGCGEGCARIHQGDYTMPVKRVIKGAVMVRVTQPGMDFITERVKTLILSFFAVDAQGRAIIPLASLGLGSLSTSLGPLDAEIRDVVLQVDFSSLEVRFVPGSSPAQLAIRVVDARVGIQQGVLSGGIDALLFSGDVGCGLANGPADRVARLDLDLRLQLATTAAGAMDVVVLPSMIDVMDVAVRLTTDCAISECLDGLSPPSTAECLECQTICPAADVAADLATVLQDAFDDLLDGLLNVLADDLANLFLSGFLNGQPLAVEGTLDVAGLIGPLVSYLEEADPIGVLARPAGDAFAVKGVGDGLGLDLLLDAGLDASPVHPCAGDVGADPVWEAGPRPAFPGVLTLPDGAVAPYHLGIGVSEALLDEALWAAWKAGALCVELTTADIANLSGGGLIITARTLDLLLPGLTRIAQPDAPVRIGLRPGLGASSPRSVRFGDGVERPLVELVLGRSTVTIDVMVGDQFMRVLAFGADARVGLAIDPLPGARLGVRIEEIGLDGLSLPTNELFADARLDLIAPFVVDLALGFLANRPLELELGTAGLGDILGVPLEPTVVDLRPAGVAEDWLAIHVALRDPLPPAAGLFVPTVRVLETRPGSLDVAIGSDLPSSPDSPSVQLRVAGGGWSRWLSVPGVHTLSHPRLWLVGDWAVEARVRTADGRVSPPRTLGELVVEAPAGPAPAADTVPLPGADAPPPSGLAPGCAGSGQPTLPWGAAALAWLWSLARRRRLFSGLAIALAIGGCNDDREAPARSCQFHDQCDNEYLCGPSGVCVPATPCTGDPECCPGSTCFSGWCRPTEGCNERRPCEGLSQVCESGRCVPSVCVSKADCPASMTCTAGRCLADLPCGGECPAGLACHVPSGRCVGASGCEGGCAPASLPVVVASAQLDPLRCADTPAECSCAPLAAVAPGLAGVDGRLVALGGAPAVISYDPEYGDLVLSRFSQDFARRSDVAVDGIGSGPIRAAPTGYREGISDPGPDRGRRPALSIVPGSSGPLIDIVAADSDTQGLRHIRYDPSNDQVIAQSQLPIEGVVGRYNCLARVQRGGGEDRLAGLTFVTADPADAVSRLVYFEASSPLPAAAADWTQRMVVQTPLPPRSESPCGDGCGFGDVCVRVSGGDRCASLPGLAQDCGAGCAPNSVCVRLSEAAPPSCEARVRRAGAWDQVPYGEGLFVSCAAANDGGIVAAWYDADRGRLLAARPPGGAPIVIDDGDAGAYDVGRHAHLVARPGGGLAVVYKDLTSRALRYASAQSVGGPWRIEIAQGPGGSVARDLGSWPRLAFTEAGDAVVAHADTINGDVWLAGRRPDGCWQGAPVYTDGSFAFPDVIVADDGAAWVSSLSYRFDARLAPRHGPIVAPSAIPACP